MMCLPKGKKFYQLFLSAFGSDTQDPALLFEAVPCTSKKKKVERSNSEMYLLLKCLD